jgi:hypothetical protein
MGLFFTRRRRSHHQTIAIASLPPPLVCSSPTFCFLPPKHSLPLKIEKEHLRRLLCFCLFPFFLLASFPSIRPRCSVSNGPTRLPVAASLIRPSFSTVCATSSPTCGHLPLSVSPGESLHSSPLLSRLAESLTSRPLFLFSGNLRLVLTVAPPSRSYLLVSGCPIACLRRNPDLTCSWATALGLVSTSPARIRPERLPSTVTLSH